MNDGEPRAPRRERRLRVPGRRMIPRAIRRAAPKTLQSRLTLGFASVVTLTLLLVTVFALNRLSDEFRSQEVADLEARSDLVAAYIDAANSRTVPSGPIVYADTRVNPLVVADLQ